MSSRSAHPPPPAISHTTRPSDELGQLPLADKKSPYPTYAHLSQLEGTIEGIFDSSRIPPDARILNLYTPLKKSRLAYTAWDSLRHHPHIEAITINELDAQRLDVLATLPRLGYLNICHGKQESIPDLACLRHVQVLLLDDLLRIADLGFISRMSTLKTLYIHGLKALRDLSPLTGLRYTLQELHLDHGRMSGTGTPVHGLDPLAELVNLQYLVACINVEHKNYDITPTLPLKKLRHLFLLPRFLKGGNEQCLRDALPLLQQL